MFVSKLWDKNSLAVSNGCSDVVSSNDGSVTVLDVVGCAWRGGGAATDIDDDNCRGVWLEERFFEDTSRMNDIRWLNTVGDDKLEDVSNDAEHGSGIWSNDGDEFLSFKGNKVGDGVELWVDGRHKRAKKFVDSVRIDDLCSLCGDGDGDVDVDTDGEVIDAR